MSHNRYDERLQRRKDEKKLRLQAIFDAERARFLAKTKHGKPQLYFTYGFSDIDPFTHMEFTWDLWVKFPFTVPKEKCEEFKELVQIAFEKVFLSA